MKNNVVEVRRAARLLLPVFLTVLGLAVVPAAPAQGAAPGLAERFPPGTLVVIRAQDVSRVLEWLGTSPFGAMVKDPEVKPLWDTLAGMARSFARRGEEKVGVNLLDLLGRIRGEVALGLTRVKIAAPPVPGLMLAVDCRDGAKAFREDLDALLQLLPEERFRRTDRELKGVPIRTFTPVKAGGRQRGLQALGAIHLAWVDSVLILGNDRSGFDRFIRASRQEDVASLGSTENWKDTMEKLGGVGDFTFYVNIQAISELIEAAIGALPEDVGPVIAALGLDEFPALGSATFLGDDALTGRFILRYTGDGKSGLGSLMQFKKADLTIPGWVPEDAWQVMVFNYDFQGAFAGFLSIVKEAGEEPYENLQQGLDEFENRFGVSLGEDLLGALSNPVILVRLAPAGNALAPPPGARRLLFDPMGGQGPMLLAVRITNRKTIDTFLEYFESMGADVSDYLGATIISGPSMGDDRPIFEFALTDTHVLFGLGTAPVVRQTLQRMGGQERGLAGVEGVRDAVAGLPREGTGLLVYNYGKALAAMLNGMKVAMQFSRKARTLARLPIPSADVLEKYLGYAAGVMTYEPGTGLIIDTTFRFQRR